MCFRYFITFLAASSIGLVLAPPAYAFKSKTHVVLANAVLADARDDRLSVPGLNELVDPKNPDLIDALKKYPEAFRAGVLGPDNYPDLAGGQIWVHSNNGSNLSDQGKAFEERRISDWRSIDYGMYLLKQAKAYRPGTAANGKALAFAYGYLTHMIGDGFAHSFVNEWAGGAWTATSGSGVYGPMTEELKHLAIEGLLDTMTPSVPSSSLEIEAPADFLNSVFLSSPKAAGVTESAGRFAGDHYVALLKLSDQLHKAASGDFGGPFADVGTTLVKVGKLAGDVGVANPADDLAYFLERRADMIDEALEKLVLLSDCIAQNIVLGANRIGTEALTSDACDQVDFEPPGSKAASVFQGALNRAAHDGGSDPGSFGNNVMRLQDYLATVLYQGLTFSAHDLAAVGRIEKLRNTICKPVFRWGSCEKACDAAHEVCTEFVERAGCGTCPTSGGNYVCSGGWFNAKGAACVAQPHCFACAKAGSIMVKVTDHTCTATVNAASPACEVCNESSLCDSLDALEELHELATGGIQDTVDAALDSLKDDAFEMALLVIFGRYYNDVRDALDTYDQRSKRGRTVWLMNAAFFREDLKAGGRPYLFRLFNQAVKVPMSAMSTTQSAAQFASSTFSYMTKPTPVGDRILWGDGSASDAFNVYKNFITFLYGLIDGDSVEVLKDEKSYWVNRIKVQGQYRRSGATNFIALLDTIGMLHTLTGPTAGRLSQEMAGQSFNIDDIDEVYANLDAFGPAYNTVQLTKLSLASAAGLNATFGTMPKQRSAICTSTAHILCDAIATLDDPNHHGPNSSPDAGSPTASGLFPLGSSADPLRSVAFWAPRKVVWSTASIEPRGPCQQAFTPLPLSRSAPLATKYYDQIFKAPQGCTSNWLAAAIVSLR